MTGRHAALRDYGLALGLVLAAGAYVHGNHVYRNFHRPHWEDWRFFRHARTRLTAPLDCFTQPEPWPGLYRPLSTNCYYFVAGKAFGNRVEAYHVVNAVLFVANGLLLFSIARRLLPGPQFDSLRPPRFALPPERRGDSAAGNEPGSSSPRSPWAFVAPLLYASRAAHFQVLLYTSEIQALLSSFFALLSIRFVVSASGRHSLRHDVLSLGALTLALLSKESMVVVPVIITAHSLLFQRQERWRRLLAAWALAGAWAVLFALAFRRVSGDEPTGYAYDVSWAIGGRYLAYFLAFFNALVQPIDATIQDTGMSSQIPALVANPWVTGSMAFAVAAALALLVRFRARLPKQDGGLRTLAFGLIWFGAGMAPFVVFADRLFLRYTYFGHGGLALAAAALGSLVTSLVVQSRAARRQTLT